MRRLSLLRLSVTIGLVFVGGGSASAAEVVVVCPPMFRSAMTPWLDFRRDEGLSVSVIESQANSAALLNSIRDIADESTAYIVLVGDAPAIGTTCNPSRQIPVGYHATTVTAAYGSTPMLSSDLGYGDIDVDGIPEASVGRLPVDTPEELESAVKKILAYEVNNDFGPWRSEVQLVGGVGGFGMMVDAAIESVTRTVVTGVLPPAIRTHVTYASVGHAFCPVDKDCTHEFSDAIIGNYARGSRFWVYAGHGQVTELDRFPQIAQHPRLKLAPHIKLGKPILDGENVTRLSRPSGGAPIALLLACYTGAIDATEDSFAEKFWLAAGGPVAVIAGSRVTMPYGNATAAVGLIDGVFEQKLVRLGDAWRGTLADMHRDTSPDQTDTQTLSPDRATSRVMIDALATMISPAGTKLVDERREHMRLYNLIGDPTMNLRHPQALEVQVQNSYASGEDIGVAVTSPIDGQLTVSIDRPLGAITQGDPNDVRVASITMDVTAGVTARPTFTLSPGSIGPMIVRASVAGQRAWASGGVQTILRAATD